MLAPLTGLGRLLAVLNNVTNIAASAIDVTAHLSLCAMLGALGAYSGVRCSIFIHKIVHTMLFF